MEDYNKSIQIVRTMKQVMDRIKQNLECQFKTMGLTGPQGMLMGNLIRFGKMKISDLSERMELSNSTVSGILDRLEKQGLIIRTRSEEDRRVVYVDATTDFKQISEKTFLEIEKLIAGQISRATPEELDKILEGLSVLQRVMMTTEK